jgi:lactoylglutathione lyase
MIRVRDLEKSLDFYTRILGMQVLRQKEYPGGKFTNTFVGYGPEETHPAIELTYNWDQEEPYDMGNGWGHVALEVPGADEERHPRHRLRRGPGRLQGRAAGAAGIAARARA